MELNTENIEEAKIVTETKIDTEADDLLARLTKKTETKLPGTVEETKTTKSFWESSDEDFEKVAEKPVSNTSKEGTESKSKEEKTESGKKEPLTDKSFHNSAANATALIEFSTNGLCQLVVNRKFKKRFTPEEMLVVNNGLDDADPKSLNEVQKTLYEKYQKLNTKKEDMLRKLPFTGLEKDVMEDAFYKLCKQRNIEIPPEAAVLMSVFTTAGSRVISVAFD